MAMLLEEIPWGDPILPVAADPVWEAEVKQRGGQVSEVDRRIAPSHWLREAAFGLTSYRPVAMPQRLFHIGAMVTSHENACRYCYGANRAYMKLLGYREDFIRRIERDLHLAELDPRDQAFIAFCRNLARSRPRPARSACDQLVALGFSSQAVNEMAFAISMGCFYNRVSTFIVCPPEHGFERMATGPMGRLIGLGMPLAQWLGRLKGAPATPAPLDPAALAGARFGAILMPLAGLPAAAVMRAALDGAFAAGVLDAATPALMFAVVARTLGCPLCEGEARKLLGEAGLSQAECESALTRLHSDRLPARDARLLAWTRSTVYYEIAKIQQETRALRDAIGDTALLEAIGVAALANATVRLAMLHE